MGRAEVGKLLDNFQRVDDGLIQHIEQFHRFKLILFQLQTSCDGSGGESLRNTDLFILL